MNHCEKAMAVTVSSVVNGRRGGLGMLTFAFVYFKTESTQSYHWVLAFCFHLPSGSPPTCSAALQWELPGSVCWGLAGPTLQIPVRCHVLLGCTLHIAPLGWGTWKLFQGCEMGSWYWSAAEENTGTTPSNIYRFWFYYHSFHLLQLFTEAKPASKL